MDVMRKNVLEFKDIMDANDIGFVLIFGTLLGIMRNGSPIPNDSDFDVFCFAKDRLKWRKAEHDLMKSNFQVTQQVPMHDDFIIRNGEKIDINLSVVVHHQKISGLVIHSHQQLKHKQNII